MRTPGDDAFDYDGEVQVVGAVGSGINRIAAINCSAVGCRRRSTITAEFVDELGRSTTDTVCCYECITGDGHSAACEAAALAATESKRRVRFGGSRMIHADAVALRQRRAEL